jgi:tetratricopeptide (TPR) repeat protein
MNQGWEIMTASFSKYSGAKPRLSVAMIVRNERDVLAESIQSVKPFADEIVVMDTGSTDQTEAIAGQLGAKVRQSVWNHSFSEVRNACLGHITGDWVLWLDAGERLLAETGKQLREFIDRHAQSSKAYMLWIEVPAKVEAACGEQAARTRLMPNRREVRFTGRVRETAEPSLKTAGIRVEMAPGRIVRHPRQHNPEIKTINAKRNFDLACRENAERHEPSPHRLLLAMGEAYSDLGLFQPAWSVFRNVIDKSAKKSAEMLEAYYGLITILDNDLSAHELQMIVCLEALEVYPFDAQLLLALGNYLHRDRQFDLAAKAFDTAIKYGQVDPSIWHLTKLTEVATACHRASESLQEREMTFPIRQLETKAA